MNLRLLCCAKCATNQTVGGPTTSKRSVFRAAAILAITSLLGCSFADYPTSLAVDRARPTVPPLETIADGRAYLAVVRHDLIVQRDNLRYLDMGLAAGIVGGLVTTALATTLKWGHHTQVTAGLLSAALIGVESTLTLKQQQLIINRGLDALLCVESQAEAAYLPVKDRDAVLAPVADDIHALEGAIAVSANIQDDALADAVADLTDAKYWFSRVSIPAASVNAAVKIAVNSVLQTTVDQLNVALPDGSAFAKISLTPPPVAAASSPAMPPGSPRTLRVPASPSTLAGVGVADRAVVTSQARREYFARFVGKLHTDIQIAEAALRTLPTVTTPAALPSFSCGVSGGPLIISPATLTIGLTQNSTAAAILGGTAPYVPEITIAAGSSGLNPGAIHATIVGPAVTVKTSAPLRPGAYNLVITDATGAQRTVAIIAKQ